MSARAILHLDMDTFFVSVERLRNPSLVGRPVVVGGSPQGRGVVASASYEARLYGVYSAMPMAEAVRRCRELVIVHGSHEEYIRYSREVRAILERSIPVVEQASVDEFYGDLTGTRRLYRSPEEQVRRVLDGIRTETGLPCSGALGTSKLVAKVATRWAKPNGCWAVPAGEEAAQFSILEIGALPGIGPVTVARLREKGIETLGQLATLPPERLTCLFGRFGPTLAARARGEDDSPVVPSSDAKSMGHETTFAKDISDPEQLKSVLWQFASQVGYQLRQEGLMARTLTLKIRWWDFKTVTRSIGLPVGTNRDYDLARIAEDLLNKALLQQGSGAPPVRLVGIRATNLLTANEQRLLFQTGEQDAQRNFYATLDAVRDRFGFGALGSATALSAAQAGRDASAAGLAGPSAVAVR